MMPPVYFVWIAVTIAACICACAHQPNYLVLLMLVMAIWMTV